ncbi:uroporphyrinogen-III synthase [Alsobacter sp. R-9]
MRVAVTRPRPAADRTAARLAALGHDPVVLPVLRIAPTGAPLPPGPFVAIAATSANALLALPDGAPGPLAGLPFHAVGAATARAARTAGFRDVRDGGGDARALAATLLAAGQRGRLLYLAGVERKPVLEQALAGSGLEPVAVEGYDAVPAQPSMDVLLGGPGPTAVLHYSRRSAEAFLAAARGAGHEAAMVSLPHLCLSPDVAAPLAAAGAPRVLVAERPDEAALLALLPAAGG